MLSQTVCVTGASVLHSLILDHVQVETFQATRTYRAGKAIVEECTKRP